MGLLDPLAVDFGGHAGALQKGGGKVFVVGKTGIVADVQQFVLPGGQLVAGGVEPDGVHILLEALVGQLFEKVGQGTDRHALLLGEVAQSDLVHIVFLHKVEQPLQPLFLGAPLLVGILREHFVGQICQGQVDELLHFANAVQLVIGGLGQIGKGHVQQQGTALLGDGRGKALL